MAEVSVISPPMAFAALSTRPPRRFGATGISRIGGASVSFPSLFPGEVRAWNRRLGPLSFPALPSDSGLRSMATPPLFGSPSGVPTGSVSPTAPIPSPLSVSLVLSAILAPRSFHRQAVRVARPLVLRQCRYAHQLVRLLVPLAGRLMQLLRQLPPP